MLKNSDTNKIKKIERNVIKIKYNITNQNVINYNKLNKINKHYIYYDVQRKNVGFGLEWETMNVIDGLSYQYQYKFWDIEIGNIDLTMLPFIKVDFLTQSNVKEIVAESYKTFAINNNFVNLHAGLYFSNHNELIEYDPVSVKLLIVFDKIPLSRIQNKTPGDNFKNIYTEAVGG